MENLFRCEEEKIQGTRHCFQRTPRAVLRRAPVWPSLPELAPLVLPFPFSLLPSAAPCCSPGMPHGVTAPLLLKRREPHELSGVESKRLDYLFPVEDAIHHDELAHGGAGVRQPLRDVP